MPDMPKISSLGDACCGCGACAAACPASCVSMGTDACGFSYPAVDGSACVGCGRCDSVCPALSGRGSSEPVGVWWAQSKDAPELLRSSSGGVFALLARSVLAECGVVAGAAWGPGFRSVRHVLVEDAADLDSVMRSKYAQSSVGPEVYTGIRDALRAGRRALFSGTACQVAGVRGYLGRFTDSDLFLSVDVVCHGAPSPGLWARWTEYKEGVAGSALEEVNMRDKLTGWQTYSVSYGYAGEGDGGPLVESVPSHDDWYMRAFLADAGLRPSCFSCPSKLSCGSDLTLGDFWGVQSAHPEVDFAGGVSAVLVNTPKGAEALEGVGTGLRLGPSSFEKVLAGNPCLARSVRPCPEREAFMAALVGEMPVEEMRRRWDFEPSLAQRLLSKLGGAKHKVKKLLGR